MAISYVPLEQETIKSITGKDQDTTINGSLFTSTSFLYNFFLVIIIVTASFRFAYAGMLRMNPSESGIKASKEEFKRVTFGLFGVLGMWLIIATFNRDMLTGNVGFADLATTGGGVARPSTQTGTPSGNTPTNATELASRAPLTSAGITFNKPGCTSSTQTDCTSVTGIQQNSIAILLDLKSNCKCSIQVTGGTEGGHSANSRHGVGKEAFDIAYTTELSNFLKTNGTNAGDNSRCNTKYSWSSGNNTFIFWDEAVGCDTSKNQNAARHFHASYNGR
jgi:hypothetical protein